MSTTTTASSKAAAALVRQRWAKRSVEKICQHCQKPFKGDATQAYCGPRHQQAAAAKRWRERNKLRPAGEEAGTGA